MKKFFITCVGCARRRMDCERIKNYLIENHLEMADSPEKADLLFVSTCGLTKHFEDKSISKIMKSKNLAGETIVYGCMPLMNGERIKSVFNGKIINTKDISNIDQIFHNFEVKFKDLHDANKEFVESEFQKHIHLKQRIEQKIKSYDLYYPCMLFNIIFMFSEKCRSRINRLLPSILTRPHIKNPPTFIVDSNNDFFKLRISRGCAGNCSYCTIKYAIGKLRSKPITELLKELRKGMPIKQYKINIISSDTGSYGIDINSNLPELLQAILDEDERITIEFIQDLHAKWVCRYKSELTDLVNTRRIKSMLIAIQSGSERILKLMNRNTDINEFKNVIREMKKLYPSLRLRTQVIVGFPSETEKDVQDTIALVNECRFDEIDIFQYVERSAMNSVKLKPKVPDEIIAERMVKIKKNLPVRMISHLMYDN